MSGLVNFNISPLPFYDSLNGQLRNRSYAYGHTYHLQCGSNRLLPFMIYVADELVSIDHVNLVNANIGEVVTDITNQMSGLVISSQYTVENGRSIQRIQYPASAPLQTVFSEGKYYLELHLATEGIHSPEIVLYSEEFYLNNSVDNERYLRLSWRNSRNLNCKWGAIDFESNPAFRFLCTLETQLGKPEYDYDEESTERGGYTFIESQTSKKTYRFGFMASESLLDAIRVAQMCDEVQIISNNKVYDSIHFEISDIDWEDQGDMASVTCEMQTDNIIFSLGGYTSKPGFDFNNDYNIDFNAE